MRASQLRPCRRGSAAAETALVMPLLLLVTFGSIEVGTYFYYEHLLVKSLRDGARFAARQDYSGYTCGSAVTTGQPAYDQTQTLVMTTLLSGGYNRLPNWNGSTITMRIDCYTTAATDPVGNVAATTQNMLGIYEGKSGGAPVVTVNAAVPYVPIVGAVFGFNPAGLFLRGSQQAAVMGI